MRSATIKGSNDTNTVSDKASNKSTTTSTAASSTTHATKNTNLVNIKQDLISNLSDITDDKTINTLLYPIAKSFLDAYPQYHDLLTSYEEALDAIPDIVGEDVVIDEYIKISPQYIAHFRLNVDNVRFYSPDSIEASIHNNLEYAPTPFYAFNYKTIYSCIVLGDIVFAYDIINCVDGVPNRLDNTDVNADGFSIHSSFQTTLPDAYCVNVPIPIGSKYCSLNHYDEETLIKTGQDLKCLRGYFIIDGIPRHLMPYYKKPFNKPITIKNDHEDQLCRTDSIYTTGYEYEESFYTIGVMCMPKSQRNKPFSMHPDYGWSLQLNDVHMYQEATGVSKKRTIYNFVPIALLFRAFGCESDFEMLRYIVPNLDNIGLMSSIHNACTKGYKHHEAYTNAGIQLNYYDDCFIPNEVITELTAKFIIGEIILNANTKDQCKKASGSEAEYRFNIASIVHEILLEKFMPGVMQPEHAPPTKEELRLRNDALCIELGTVIRKLYNVANGFEESEDKTSLVNRRIIVGRQFAQEYKTFHKIRVREILNEVVNAFDNAKHIKNIAEVITSRISSIAKTVSNDQTRSLINSFKGTSKEHSKLRAEVMVPKNQAFVHNHLREIVLDTDNAKQGSTFTWEHRTVNQSELFFICPTQTPEGGSQVGKYRTPTVFSYVTCNSSEMEVKRCVEKHHAFIKDFRECSHNFKDLFVIKVNGYIYGYVLGVGEGEYENKDAERLYEDMMLERARGTIWHDVSIILDRTQGKIDFWTDTSRIVAPFVVVKECFDVDGCTRVSHLVDGKGGRDKSSDGDGKVKVSVKPEFIKFLNDIVKNCTDEDVKSDVKHSDAEGEDSKRDTDADNKGTSLRTNFMNCIRKHYVELLCPEMCIQNAVIAPSIEEFYAKPHMYTHIAMPNSVHGIIAGIVPAINMNAGVRTSYSTNHVKQAIGQVFKYPQLTCITEHNLLTAPQIPLVRPYVYDALHMPENPIGQNVMVAFMQYKYNQEDAIILNKASVESGLLKIDSIVTKSHKIEKNDEDFSMPPGSAYLIGNGDSYDKISPKTALPKRVSDLFYTNDVLIAKINKVVSNVNDTSVVNEKPDGVELNSSTPRPLRCIVKNKVHDDNAILKMCTFGQYRAPVHGDKFNSEQAQKGTCGAIMDPSTIPYTTTGLRPDIIFNPPAVFKRKTFGQLYVGILSKVAALLGCPLDCTPYNTIRSEEDIMNVLKAMGLDDAGYETMFDPDTGRAYKCRIFFANHYWERQNHLVEQKINVRNGGFRDLITGLPTKGRKFNGGQSVERMCMDAQLASGVCETIRDIHLNQGAQINMTICNQCKCPFSYLHKELNVYCCPRCGTHPNFTVKKVPPASMLLHHVFNGLHVGLEYNA